MKKYISVSLSVIFAFALIFSAPSSLLFLYSAKAQVGSSIFQGAATRSPNVLPLQNSLRLVPPVANAGQNKMVQPGATVFLNGSASFDPNLGGSIVNYRWTQVSGIPVILQNGNGIGVGTAVGPNSGIRSSSSSSTQFASFTAPMVATTITFSLTVMDNHGLISNPSFVSVLVIPQSQQQLLQSQRQLQQQPSITPQQSLPQQQLPLLQSNPFIGTNTAHGNGPSSSSLNGQLQTLLSPKSQYRSPAYQYHPNLAAINNNPFTSKQSHPNPGRIPSARNAIRNQNPMLISPLNNGNLKATNITSQSSNLKQQSNTTLTPKTLPAVNGTLTELKNSGIVAASKTGQTSGTSLTGVTPKSENVTKNLKNTLGVTKTSQTNATRGQNQINTNTKSTNLTTKPKSLAALAPANGTSKNITKTSNKINTAKTSTRFASASPLSQTCTPSASTAGPVVNCAPVGTSPSDVVSVQTGYIYVTNPGSNTVSVINPDANAVTTPQVTTISHPSFNAPTGEAVSSVIVGSKIQYYVYVSNFNAANGGADISVINATSPGSPTFNQVITTITGIPNPRGPTFDFNNNDIYVPGGDGNVYIIDADPNHSSTTFNQVLNLDSPIVVGGGLNQALFVSLDDGTLNLVYVTNTLGTVSAINDATNAVTAVSDPNHTFNNPTALIYDSFNGDLYVTNSASGSNTVSVIDATSSSSSTFNQVIGNPIPVGTAPDGGAFSSFTGYVYISNSGSNDMSVIDGNAGSSTENEVLFFSPIASGLSAPTGADLDPITGRDLYVANHGTTTNPGNSVTVISDGITLNAPAVGTVAQVTPIVNGITINNPVGIPGQTSESVTVDWGDGSANSTNIPISQPTSTSNSIWPSLVPVMHTYNTAGTYTITAQLVIACEFCNQASSYATKSITISAPTPPLAVSSTDPDAKTPPVTGVATSPGTVTAVFNQAVNPTSIVSPATTFSLKCGTCNSGDPGTVPGKVSLSNGGTTATFQPDSPLQPFTTYTATISTGVQDTNGNNLASAKTWSFTTGATTSTITITSVTPTSPKWGIDPVVVSGTSTNAVGDTVTITWGDGTATTGISINSNDGSWSSSTAPPPPHTYPFSVAGTQPTIVAQLISSCDIESTCAGPSSNNIKLTSVLPHKTSLTLEPVNSTTAGTTTTAVGQLVDQDLLASSSSPSPTSSTSQVPGKLITFALNGGNIFSNVEPNEPAPGQPVKTAGVNFTDPTTSFVNIHQCTNCIPDSGGGTVGNNNVMHLHAGSTINLPPGVTEVTLSIQDMGSSSFRFEYTKSDSTTPISDTYGGGSTGSAPTLMIIGGQSGSTPISVKQIKIDSVTDSAADNPVPGTVGIAKMTLQNLFGNPQEIQTIDFEDLTAGSTTYTATAAKPFTVDAGLYFSVGTTQGTPQDSSSSSSPPLQVQANFAGDNAYRPAVSNIQKYSTEAPTCGATSGLIAPCSANGGGTAPAQPIPYNGAVFSASGPCTASEGGDTDHDGICDAWETPNTGQYPFGLPPTKCPKMHDCIPITTTSGAHQFYDLCIKDAYSYAWGGTANKLVCPTIGHKDIYLEIDSMQGQAPVTGAIPLIIKAFGNSPVTATNPPSANLSGTTGPPQTTGITLHVVNDESAAVAHQSLFTVWKASSGTNDFVSTKAAHFGTVNERQCAGAVPFSASTCSTTNTLWKSGCPATPATSGITVGPIQCPRDAKAQVYHYALFINNWSTTPDGCGPTGVSESPGNDIVVALGGVGCGLGGSNGFGGSTGTADEQAGTLMHEFGHNLDLNHGGPQRFLNADGTTNTAVTQPSGTDVAINCKPNYLSVMTYARQMPTTSFIGAGTPWETQGLDYSRWTPSTVLDSLSESGLSETAGIGTSTTHYPRSNTVLWGITSSSGAITVNKGGITSATCNTTTSPPSGSCVDWNKNGAISGTASEDANSVAIPNCPLSPTSLQTYSAYDDWDNLLYNFRGTALYIDGLSPNSPNNPPEMTGPMLQTLRNEAFAGQGFTLVQPIVNTMKCPGCTSGSTIPVKFQLKDIYGKFITTAKVTFTAQRIDAAGNPIDSLIVGAVPFTYSTSTNLYQYNWKTGSPTSPAGTYILRLYIDYSPTGSSPTQQLLVGKGQTDFTTMVILS